MRGRRQNVLGLVVLAAGFSLLGLSAFDRSLPTPEVGDCAAPGELGKLHEIGASECQEVDQEYQDACAASWVSALCPLSISCEERDPFWCAPCADKHGVNFWTLLGSSLTMCNDMLGWDHSQVDKAAYVACFQAKVEQRCPELAGTDWFEWHQNLARSKTRKSFILPTF